MMGGKKRGGEERRRRMTTCQILSYARLNIINFLFFFLIIIIRTFIISSRIKRDIWPKFSSKARNGNLRIHPLPVIRRTESKGGEGRNPLAQFSRFPRRNVARLRDEEGGEGGEAALLPLLWTGVSRSNFTAFPSRRRCAPCTPVKPF